MKTLIIYLFAFVLFMPSSVFAQPTKYLKLGVNYSFFRTEGGKSKPGLTFGFGKDFYLIRSFNVFLGLDLYYTTKKIKLVNKTWPTDSEPELSDVRVGDIPLDRSYIDFRIKLGYSLPLSHNKSTIELFAGPLFSFPIKYLSRFLADSTIFLDPDEMGKYKFDYLRCESEGADKILHWFMGAAILRNNFGIEIHYDVASRQYCFRGLTINDSLDSFHVLFLYGF